MVDFYSKSGSCSPFKTRYHTLFFHQRRRHSRADPPRPEPLGQVAPRGSGLGDPEDRDDEESVVLSGHARVTGLA